MQSDVLCDPKFPSFPRPALARHSDMRLTAQDRLKRPRRTKTTPLPIGLHWQKICATTNHPGWTPNSLPHWLPQIQALQNIYAGPLIGKAQRLKRLIAPMPRTCHHEANLLSGLRKKLSSARIRVHGLASARCSGAEQQLPSAAAG